MAMGFKNHRSGWRDASRTCGDVLLGVDIAQTSGVTVGLTITAQLSENSCDIGGGLQLRLNF